MQNQIASTKAIVCEEPNSYINRYLVTVLWRVIRSGYVRGNRVCRKQDIRQVRMRRSDLRHRCDDVGVGTTAFVWRGGLSDDDDDVAGRELYDWRPVDERSPAGDRLQEPRGRRDDVVAGSRGTTARRRRDGDAHTGGRVRALLPAAGRRRAAAVSRRRRRLRAGSGAVAANDRRGGARCRRGGVRPGRKGPPQEHSAGHGGRARQVSVCSRAEGQDRLTFISCVDSLTSQRVCCACT